MKKIIFVVLCLWICACQIENINYFEPIMITDPPSNIIGNSAILGGQVVNEGGQSVTECGIVWSKTPSPTILENKQIAGERLDMFSNRYEGLESNTTYYYAAYGINNVGVGYGTTYEFTTTKEADCNPIENNFIDFGFKSINIDQVKYQEPFGFNEGNVEFKASSNLSAARITLQFYEIDGAKPLAGAYVTIREFDNQSRRSDGKVKVSVTDFGGGPTGGVAKSGEYLYIETENDNITFIFCDIPVSTTHILNGKFTY